MNCFEDIINGLLKENSDIAAGMINAIDLYSGEGRISLSPETLHQVMVGLAGDLREEDIWDKLLSIMLPDQISDEVIDYLIQNKIALMQLCHMELSDKWLKKLVLYDDAPLYTLAKRYYLRDQYSSSEFICFFQQYLRYRDCISIHLLELYKNATKRELLLYLCFKNEDFEDKKKLEWLLVANQLKTMTDEDSITDIYEKNKNVGVIMLSVANNLFAAKDVLLELSSIKGIAGAAEIRKISKETLRLKSSSQQL